MSSTCKKELLKESYENKLYFVNIPITYKLVWCKTCVFNLITTRLKESSQIPAISLSEFSLKLDSAVTIDKGGNKEITVPAGIYLLKVNNRNTRTRCEICSKLTINTPERRHWRRSGVFIVNFEHISHLVLLFLLLTLNK